MSRRPSKRNNIKLLLTLLRLIVDLLDMLFN